MPRRRARRLSLSSARCPSACCSSSRPSGCSFASSRRSNRENTFILWGARRRLDVMRTFQSLSEQEILALAISLEEEDARIYGDFAEGLEVDYPATAAILDGMRAEEDGHRHRLIELHRQKFGEHIPLIRRHDVKGFVHRKPIWLV